MGSSRITTWDELTVFAGTEALAVDDGLNKKVLADNLFMPKTTAGSAKNMSVYASQNNIDVSVEGSSIIAGQNNTLNSDWGVAFGKGAHLEGIAGGLSHTARNILVAGDCNSIQFQLGGRSTDGTTTILLSADGVSDYVAIQDDSAWMGEAYIVAVDEATGDVSAWKLPFACKMVSGTASRLYGEGNDAVDIIDEIVVDGPNTPQVNIDSSGFFRISVLGIAGKNIKWAARVQLSEVRF